MALYQLIASILLLDKSGWTKEMYPETAEHYDELTTAISLEQMDKAKQIMLEHFTTENDSIEEHNDWYDELVIDEDMDGIWLFKRLAEVTGEIGGHPFYCQECGRKSLQICYINTDGEEVYYYPCEEDKDPIRPLLESATLGNITQQEACEEIARIMHSWDYNIQL
jgi:hypothetical protein